MFSTLPFLPQFYNRNFYNLYTFSPSPLLSPAHLSPLPCPLSLSSPCPPPLSSLLSTFLYFFLFTFLSSPLPTSSHLSPTYLSFPFHRLSFPFHRLHFPSISSSTHPATLIRQIHPSPISVNIHLNPIENIVKDATFQTFQNVLGGEQNCLEITIKTTFFC